MRPQKILAPPATHLPYNCIEFYLLLCIADDAQLLKMLKIIQQDSIVELIDAPHHGLYQRIGLWLNSQQTK